MRAPAFARSFALEKLASGKTHRAQHLANPVAIEGESKIHPAIGQPRKLDAQHCVRLRPASGKERGSLRRIVEIILLRAVRDGTTHGDTPPGTSFQRPDSLGTWQVEGELGEERRHISANRQACTEKTTSRLMGGRAPCRSGRAQPDSRRRNHLPVPRIPPK